MTSSATLLRIAVVVLCALGGCRRAAEPAFVYSSDAPSRAGLVRVEGGVVLGNEAGAVVRLGADGQPRWRAALGREVAARPAVAGDTVVAGTVTGVLAALSLDTGEQRWRFGDLPPVLTPLVADARSVYVVSPEGEVRAHALDTGVLRWRRAAPPGLAGPSSNRPLPAPALTGALLLVSLPGGVAALDVDDGEVRWTHALPAPLGLWLEGDVAYTSARDGRVLALAVADGRVRWERHAAEALTSAPSLAHGMVWAGVAPHGLVALRPRDGSELGRRTLPAPLVTQVVEAPGGLVVVPTSDRAGRLLAFRGPQGEPALELRTDTPLRTPPVALGDAVLVLGLDGRVLAWRVAGAPKS